MFKRLKIKKVGNRQLKIIGIVILLLALPLTLILVRTIQDQRSSAATPDNLETESGVLSSSGVSKQSDSGASGGQFVRFAKDEAGPTPTSPPATSNNVGPRYSSTLGWPTLPSNYRVVPSSVPHDGVTDAYPALQAFIEGVPDGTTIVFNQNTSPPSGTQTVYAISRRLEIMGRENIVLWGYNAKLKLLAEGPGAGETLYQGIHIGYGSQDIEVLGFEIEGTNYPASLHDLHWTLSGGENAAGIGIAAARRVVVRDNTVHHTHGHMIYHYMWHWNYEPYAGRAMNWIATDADGQYFDNGGFYFEYNYAHHIGQAAIGNGWGDGIYIRYNLFEDLAAWAINWEDGDAPLETAAMRPFDNVFVTDNIFRRYNWWLRYSCTAIMCLAGGDQPLNGTINAVHGKMEHIEISRNTFDEGCMGIGNSQSPGGVDQWWDTCPRHILFSQVGTPSDCGNLIIEDNVFNLNANNLNCIKQGYYHWGALVSEWNCDNIRIRNNDFDNEQVVITNTPSSNVIFTGNESSPIYYR